MENVLKYIVLVLIFVSSCKNRDEKKNINAFSESITKLDSLALLQKLKIDSIQVLDSLGRLKITQDSLMQSLNFSSQIDTSGLSSEAKRAYLFVNEDFIHQPFNKRISYQNLNEMFDSCNFKIIEKTTFKNIHENFIDTICTFSHQNTEFYFYKFCRNRYQSLFLGANISDKNIRLRKGIGVGMEKNAFLKTFQISSNIKKDTFLLTDVHHLAYYWFYFRRDTLAKICMEEYLD